MNIYIMRHGETVWNKIGRVQGRSNNRLSKNGIIQVESKAEEYRDIKFDLIIASPLTRTIQTANIMNKYHNVKIFKDERIIEIDQGELTRRMKSTFTDIDRLNYRTRPTGCGIETFSQLYVRIKGFVKYLKDNFSNETILIVTHGAPAQYLYHLLVDSNFSEKDLRELKEFKNSEIKFCEI